jgi:glycosyltransferase involved in cell wall biosynthesis
MRKFRKVNREDKVDLVEAAESGADSFFISMLLNRPAVIVRLHTAYIFAKRLNKAKPGISDGFKYWLEKRSILWAEQITSPSQAMVDLTKTWIPLAGHPVAVVPNPIDANAFAPDGTSRKTEVLIVGRLERRKLGRLPEAIPKVLARCPGLRFRFVGHEVPDVTGIPWAEQLCKWVTPSQRRLLVFEHVPREALVARYREAAVAVMASDWENFPYALLEAMACGTPVVATNTGGVPELVSEGVSGVLVAPDDADALADAICGVVGNARVMGEMGANARILVEKRFSLEKVIPQMQSVYESACNCR